MMMMMMMMMMPIMMIPIIMMMMINGTNGFQSSSYYNTINIKTSRNMIDWEDYSLRYKNNTILIPPSKEQKIIVETYLSKKYNIKVDAVAGSGKTTTILHCANLIDKDESCLALLYNARLKDETRKKTKQLNLERSLKVHSYHSFAVKYYGAVDAFKDEGLNRVVYEGLQPKDNFGFNYIILDEVQVVIIINVIIIIIISIVIIITLFRT